MTALSDPARLRRVVAQHAMTSRLLGVDFVPLGRGAAASSPDVETLEDRTEGLPSQPSAFKPQRRPLADPLTEPKPMPSTKPVAAAVRTSAGPLPLDLGGGGQVGEPVGGFAPLPKHAPDRAAALLGRLRQRYEADAPHKDFVTSFTNIVFGEGDPAARLMFVGEAPGADEDRTGRPFVGRAGQLLEKMINAMGLKREQVYIANVLKTRPPNNATPTLEEAAVCAPYLFEQIGIIRPEVIVTLGLPAVRTLLNTTESMGRLRGRWSSFTPPRRSLLQPDNPELGNPAGGGEGGGGGAIAVMPTYHPAFLLRSYTKENREKVWSDLKMAMDRLGLTPTGAGA